MKNKGKVEFFFVTLLTKKEISPPRVSKINMIKK